MQEHSREWQSLLERYRNELLQLQHKTAIPTQAAPAPAPAEPAPPFSAPLQVRVSSANEAIPIADALVRITRAGEETVLAVRTTNPSGLTEPTLLPATDPALTLQPGTVIPSLLYTVSVQAPAHYRTVVRDIPLYGGIPTLLPVSLVPLPEFVRDNGEMTYDTPPLDL